MPFKFNADRRHRFEKPGYRVTNWTEYNESLRRRGDLTVWFDADAVRLWSAPRRTTRGGQPRYSELAIEICLTLRVAFGLPLRQTQGLVRSIARLCELPIEVPCFSTLSRRSAGLKLRPLAQPRPGASVHLVVDSTGLKIFGAGEWQAQKHGTPVKRRSWRKLHLGLDLASGDILCTELTTDEVGDPTALPGLLDQHDGPLDRFLADGAFDGSPTYELLAERFGAAIDIAIPPPKNAVASADAARNPTSRDRHIAAIAAHGRMAWQRSTGYNQRARVETQMGRWKAVIGPSLRARNFENQKTEAAIAARVLNRMTALGRPQYERIA